MSLTPEAIPVTVYRWDDPDAPLLQRNTQDSVSTIFKACLVTGYGSKTSAGWELAYEDNANRVKVIKPAASPEQDYYLRLSADSGRKLTPQVYTSMTDVNTGDLKLQCATEFKYGAARTTGKWMLIASARSFWFFCETSNGNSIQTEKSGSYFFCGDTKKNIAGFKAIYLKHTGGSWGDSDDDRYDIFSPNKSGATSGKLFEIRTQTVHDLLPRSFFDGAKNESSSTVAFPLYLQAAGELYELPALAPSRNDKTNYDTIESAGNQYAVHATASIGKETNLLIPIDFW